MSCICVICFDQFEKDDDIVVTLCSHVYHKRCILNCLKSSSNCPECRRIIKADNIQKLYINVQPAQSHNVTIDEETAKNISSMEKVIEYLKTDLNKIIEKEEAVRKCLKKVEQDLHKEKQKNYKLESSISRFNSVQSKNSELLEENNRLKHTLQNFQNIETLINGSAQEVEMMLNSEGHDTKHLVTLNVLVKKTLSKTIESKEEVKRQLAHSKKQIGILTHELNMAKQTINNLKHEISNMEESRHIIMSQEYKSPQIPCSSTPTNPFSSNTVNCLDFTPISVPENPIKRKFQVVVQKEASSVKSFEANILFKHRVPAKLNTVIKDETSVVQIGYDGFGGHGKTIMPSSGFTVRHGDKVRRKL